MDMKTVMKCREDGMTYAEIADKFDVSRQAVHQAVYRYKKFNIKETTCIYPGLRSWLVKNHLRANTFCRMCACPEVSMYSLRGHLKGAHQMTKPAIDVVLKHTGLTYEEAFGYEALG